MTGRRTPIWRGEKCGADCLSGRRRAKVGGMMLALSRGEAMRRRDFISLVGAASIAWPLAARAQQTGKLPKLGFLTAGSPGATFALPALLAGLRQLGWIEGKTIVIEYRYAENRNDRLAELAAELVRLNVDVIVAAGTLAPLAAKQASTTIPIVMTSAGDPLESGLVASLAQPGGNVTGLSLMMGDVSGKRVELLKELVPGLARVAVLWNATNPYSTAVFKETEDAARTLAIDVQSLGVKDPADFASAFELARQKRPEALFTIDDPLTLSQRDPILSFAAAQRLPAIYGVREFATAGGLMAYGASVPDLYRRAAAYADKILRGAKPSALPVEQPTKFDFVINLKTAKAIGLVVPQTLLVAADEVIE
jgi:putative tryptophan/tyrosine transport system substrate-binding protein